MTCTVVDVGVGSRIVFEEYLPVGFNRSVSVEEKVHKFKYKLRLWCTLDNLKIACVGEIGSKSVEVVGGETPLTCIDCKAGEFCPKTECTYRFGAERSVTHCRTDNGCFGNKRYGTFFTKNNRHII